MAEARGFAYRPRHANPRARDRPCPDRRGGAGRRDPVLVRQRRHRGPSGVRRYRRRLHPRRSVSQEQPARHGGRRRRDRGRQRPANSTPRRHASARLYDADRRSRRPRGRVRHRNFRDHRRRRAHRRGSRYPDRPMPRPPGAPHGASRRLHSPGTPPDRRSACGQGGDFRWDREPRRLVRRRHRPLWRPPRRRPPDPRAAT